MHEREPTKAELLLAVKILSLALNRGVARTISLRRERLTTQLEVVVNRDHQCITVRPVK